MGSGEFSPLFFFERKYEPPPSNTMVVLKHAAIEVA
jgi:hypothetical protein